VLAADGTRIAGTVPSTLAPGAAAVASVRPERIRLFPSPETANRIAGTVEALAYQGLDLQLHLVRVTADAADRRPVSSGDAVELGWDAADVRIFAD
jgi:ABC-type Fe3+/spermidine/putrescine transport system ATPase subunit